MLKLCDFMFIDFMFMFSVGWAAELRFRGRAEGAYCLGLEGGISRTEPQSAHDSQEGRQCQIYWSDRTGTDGKLAGIAASTKPLKGHNLKKSCLILK